MARKLPQFLPDDVPEKLLAATKTERDRLLLMAMLYFGLRVSEVCKLQVAHLDFTRRLLFVREGKGSKDRVLPLPRRLIGPFRGWLAGRKSGYVFPSPYGGRLSNRAVQHLIKRVAADAGFQDADQPRRYHPHALRHVFASRLLERSGNIIAVRDALGHASVATTQIYTHANPDHLRESMEI